MIHLCSELLQEKRALEAHFHNGTVQALDAQSRDVIVFLNLGNSSAQLDAFAVVSFLYRWREVALAASVPAGDCRVQVSSMVSKIPGLYATTWNWRHHEGRKT